jgi:hypothetical protein
MRRAAAVSDSGAPHKYPGESHIRERWDRAKPRGTLGIGSIFYLAKQRGWSGPANSAIRDMNERFGIFTHAAKTMIIIKDSLREHEFSWLGVQDRLVIRNRKAELSLFPARLSNTY